MERRGTGGEEPTLRAAGWGDREEREDFLTKIAPRRLHARSRSRRPTRAPLPKCDAPFVRAPLLLRSHLLRNQIVWGVIRSQNYCLPPAAADAEGLVLDAAAPLLRGP